jgi:hypothetical protein
MNLIFGMVRVFEIAVFALVSAGNRLGEAEFSAKQNPRMPTWRFVALDFPNANIFQTQTFSKREPIFPKREHFQNAGRPAPDRIIRGRLCRTNLYVLPVVLGFVGVPAA